MVYAYHHELAGVTTEQKEVREQDRRRKLADCKRDLALAHERIASLETHVEDLTREPPAASAQTSPGAPREHSCRRGCTREGSGSSATSASSASSASKAMQWKRRDQIESLKSLAHVYIYL